MYVLNEAHFKGTSQQVEEIRTTIVNLVIEVWDVTTYIDTIGRVHLIMEFETEGFLDTKVLNKWQQVEMSLHWIPACCDPDTDWTEWKPAVQRAKQRWNL